MLKKSSIFLITSIFLIFLIFLYQNKNMNNEDVQAAKRYNLKELTRVDVEFPEADGTYEEAAKITDTKTIDYLREIFKQITWEPNAEAKLAGPEDAKLSLHYKHDEHEPGQLSEYLVFFANSNDQATIISSHPAEGLGTIEQDAHTLSDLLLKK